MSFSGDLDAQIFTNPFYFQTEKTYLRAQIARIASSTTLAAVSEFKIDEDSKDIVPDVGEDDNPKPKPTTEQMVQASQWAHINPSILKQGRCRQPEPNPADFPEDTPEEEMKRLTELKDPSEPKLKLIGSDSKVRGGLPPWLIKSYGMNERTTDMQGKTTCHGIVVVKSLWWPGAYNFFSKGRTSQIYCGDGLK